MGNNETADRYVGWITGVSYCVYTVRKMSQVSIAKECGIKSQSLNAILKGRYGKRASGGLQDKISTALGYTYEEMLNLGRWIIEGNDPEEWQKPSCPQVVPQFDGGNVALNGRANIETTQGTSVPIISWVQAGAWSEVSDPFPPGEAEDFVFVCRNVSRNTFALRIKGDSMVPEFLPGEIIIVDPAVQPETGKYVIAKTENGNGDDEEATFKQFIRDGDEIFLKALNPDYGIKNMTGKKFRIVGCVVQKSKEY